MKKNTKQSKTRPRRLTTVSSCPSARDWSEARGLFKQKLESIDFTLFCAS